MNHPLSNKKFLELIEENKGLILKICLFYAKTDADRQDLLQDIVLQAWKSYPSFREESRFSTWLYSVSLHTALFMRRKQKPETSPLTADIPDNTLYGAGNDQLEQLNLAIAGLNEIEKSIVLLYLDGYAYEEMENITGISNGALRVKMSRIKQKLKTLIK